MTRWPFTANYKTRVGTEACLSQLTLNSVDKASCNSLHTFYEFTRQCPFPSLKGMKTECSGIPWLTVNILQMQSGCPTADTDAFHFYWFLYSYFMCTDILYTCMYAHHHIQCSAMEGQRTASDSKAGANMWVLGTQYRSCEEHCGGLSKNAPFSHIGSHTWIFGPYVVGLFGKD